MSKPPKVTSIADIHEKAKHFDVVVNAHEELHNRIKALEEENKHLKELLMSTSKSLVVSPSSMDSGEMVADYELKRLEEAARTRPLSLEEARIYDIMIRGKKTLKELEKDSANTARDVTGVSVEALVEAAKKENEPGSNI
jgi:hypothetical protein